MIMTNIEQILEKLQTSFSLASDKISGDASKRVKKIEAQKQAELKKVVVESEKRREQAMNGWISNSAYTVFGQLEQDYETMQSRSALSVLTAEEVANAMQIHEVLKQAKTEREIHFAQELVSKMPISTRIKDAIRFISENKFSPEYINSYISSDNQDSTCQLVCPIKEENQGLAKKLEDRVFQTLDQENLALGLDARLKKGDITARVNIVKFNADPDVANGYIVYLINQISSKPHEFVGALVKTFAELQPEGFKDASLAHRVLETDPKILRYILENPINLEQGQRTTIPVTRDTQEVKYTPENAKSLALTRLNALHGQELTTSQLAYVLGYKSNFAAIRMADAIESRREGTRKLIRFKRDAVKQFIENTPYTGGGWRDYSQTKR